MDKPKPSPPFYFQRDGDSFVPGALTRNPWLDNAVAEGPLAALVGEVIAGAAFDPTLEITRLTLDILGKVPARPLLPRITALRQGRQMQLHRIELLADGVVAALAHVQLARAAATPLVPPPCDYPLPDTVAERKLLASAAMAGAIRSRPVLGGVDRPGRGVCWLAMDGEVVAGVTPRPVRQGMPVRRFRQRLRQRHPPRRVDFCQSRHIDQFSADAAERMVADRRRERDGRQRAWAGPQHLRGWGGRLRVRQPDDLRREKPAQIAQAAGLIYIT